MNLFSSIADLRNALRDKEVAFVPTMGYLHDGHASLIRLAASTGMTLVVSIFVNPTQFNDPADLEQYPSDVERDKAIAQAAGCDILFAPTVDEIYPPGDSTRVVVSGVTEFLEGPHRPGHFEGVATVVAKLFVVVQPNVAIFGEKDWQQCCVIQRMVWDLQMPIDLVFAPTIREPDGLAMSSRNMRLNPEQRMIAPKLYASLAAAAHSIRLGQSVAAVESEAKKSLSAAGFQVEYFSVVESNTLKPTADSKNLRILAAARLGEIRLIDNVAV